MAAADELVKPKAREDVPPRSAMKRLTREEALAAIARGIGSRPDLPPGSVYVRRVRGVWRGIFPNA